MSSLPGHAFGGAFEVYRHSQLRADLVKQGRLKPSSGLDETVSFHDPLYLERYNSTYEGPQEVRAALSRLKRVEIKKSRERKGLKAKRASER